MLSEKPMSFSEILEELGISSSHLTYQLEKLGELVSKMENGKYKLSTFGEATVATMSSVEEAPKTTEPKHPLSLPLKWKSFFAVLMIGLIILAGVCYTQFQEYKQLEAEYEDLNELVTLTQIGDVSLQSKYTLRFFSRREANATELIMHGPWNCLIYSPYDNSTLYLVLSIVTPMRDSYVAVSLQEGNAYDPTTIETATVIWGLNATESNILCVPLPAKGWYTISLVGPIRKHLDISGRIVGYTIGPMPGAFGDTDCSLSLRIISNGDYTPFIVTTEASYWISYILPT